jgi:hypothetical protein
MAGFPQEGKYDEIGRDTENLPVPFPCLRTSFFNKGPGRKKGLSGKMECQSA